MIGAGQMGAGIAQVSAEAGYHVLLSDMSVDSCRKGQGRHRQALGRAVDQGQDDAGRRRYGAGADQPVADHGAFAPCDLVIEAATEREEIKRAIFDSVGKHTGRHRDPGDQHQLDPDHPPGASGARSGAVHRRAFLQSGAGDGTDRADSRPRHQRRDAVEPSKPMAAASARRSSMPTTRRVSSSTAS